MEVKYQKSKAPSIINTLKGGGGTLFFKSRNSQTIHDILISLARIFKVSTDYLLGVERKEEIDLSGLSKYSRTNICENRNKDAFPFCVKPELAYSSAAFISVQALSKTSLFPESSKALSMAMSNSSTE